MQRLTFIWVTAVMGNGLGTDFRTTDTALWGQSTGGNGGGSVTQREDTKETALGLHRNNHATSQPQGHRFGAVNHSLQGRRSYDPLT